MTLGGRLSALPARIHLVLAVGVLLSPAAVVAVDQGLPSSSIPTAPLAPVGGFNPTRSPARFPTQTPGSQFGTYEPTFGPTNPQTVDPTWNPSPAPSSFPSEFPVSPPTPRPTRIYTDAPVGSPTPEPTRINTDAPVDSPALEPSFVTDFPTFFPTVETPTTTSTTPARSPTMAPTLDLQDYLISVIMYLEYAQILGSSSEITFQRVTGDFIEAEFFALDALEWTDVSVGTNVKSQRELAELPATAGSRRTRSLQAPVSVLEITFDTQVSFRSELFNLDIAAFIGGAFNTEEDRVTYIKDLQSSGDRAFSYVSSVKIVINGEEQDVIDAAPLPSSGGLSSFTLYIIIGAAGGGLVIAILATLFYLRHKGKRKPVTVASTNNSGGHMGERVGADIVMDNQDDISTLGDPMYAPGGMMMGAGLDRDETVSPSIVSGDWDYAKNYGVAAGPDTRLRTDTLQSSQNGSYADLSSFGGLTKMDNSIFSDDMSFEQQFVEVEERFEVDAPAGKLGMVIDTPSGGVPIVHAIKNSSILADRVEVGDRLISVDDEDTTGLTAMQVSKMISQKAENPSRILVFARTRARAMSGDGMPQ
jgi:hypothetical protein